MDIVQYSIEEKVKKSPRRLEYLSSRSLVSMHGPTCYGVSSRVFEPDATSGSDLPEILGRGQEPETQVHSAQFTNCYLRLVISPQPHDHRAR